MKLETLVLEFGADFAALDAALERARKKTEGTAKSIEAILKKINSFPIDIKVFFDPGQLVGIREKIEGMIGDIDAVPFKLFDQAKKFFDDLIARFNSIPADIKSAGDFLFRSVERAAAVFSKIPNLLPSFGAAGEIVKPQPQPKPQPQRQNIQPKPQQQDSRGGGGVQTPKSPIQKPPSLSESLRWLEKQDDRGVILNGLKVLERRFRGDVSQKDMIIRIRAVIEKISKNPRFDAREGIRILLNPLGEIFDQTVDWFKDGMDRVRQFFNQKRSLLDSGNLHASGISDMGVYSSFPESFNLGAGERFSSVFPKKEMIDDLTLAMRGYIRSLHDAIELLGGRENNISQKQFNLEEKTDPINFDLSQFFSDMGGGFDLLRGLINGAIFDFNALGRIALDILSSFVGKLLDLGFDLLFGRFFGGGLFGKNLGSGGGSSLGFVPFFAEGGTVGNERSSRYIGKNPEKLETGKFVPFFAGGGTVGESLRRERLISGKQPELVVAHRGEEILTTLNKDAQFWRVLKRSGQWDELKTNGGSIRYETRNDGGMMVAGLRPSRRTSAITNNFYIDTPDTNSFRATEKQITESMARRLREVERR